MRLFYICRFVSLLIVIAIKNQHLGIPGRPIANAVRCRLLASPSYSPPQTSLHSVTSLNFKLKHFWPYCLICFCIFYKQMFRYGLHDPSLSIMILALSMLTYQPIHYLWRQHKLNSESLDNPQMHLEQVHGHSDVLFSIYASMWRLTISVLCWSISYHLLSE